MLYYFVISLGIPSPDLFGARDRGILFLDITLCKNGDDVPLKSSLHLSLDHRINGGIGCLATFAAEKMCIDLLGHPDR